MDLTAARAVLGVEAGQEWTEIRAAYRERIRRAHPDVAGASGIDESLRLNAAYRALSVARREGRLHEPERGPATHAGRTTAATPTATGPVRDGPGTAAGSEGPPRDATVVGGDTIVLASTPAETFRRLVEATHQIGDLSYVDRSSAIFEAVLALDDGTHASFVVSLQWRAHDATCEAFCTLEALNRAEQLDVSGVLRQLLEHLPPDRGA